MADAFVIEGTKPRGEKIPRGACRCVTNPRTGRTTRICKDERGPPRIKGKCSP